MTPFPMLQLHHISKTFGRGASAVRALTDVSLVVPPGQATALLGENGAGKTTLMNVLAGLVRPDRGDITLDNQPVNIPSPQRARRLGIGMVHQHFKLVEAMSVAENVALSLPDLPWRIRQRALLERIDAATREYRLDLDPRRPVEQLSVGQRQRVEILKVLMQQVRFLVLDEPTAVLTPGEAGELFDIIRKLCADGMGVVFITHRLQEVNAVCRQVTVLRRGAVTHQGVVDENTTAAHLAGWMVGRNAAAALTRTNHKETPGHGPGVILRVENLTVPALRRRSKPLVENVSLEIHAGEVLGVAGVDGNGQRELCEALCGLRPSQGRVLLDGKDISGWTAVRRFAAGIAHIADDRQREGLILPMSLAENLALKAHGRQGFSRLGWLRVRAWQDRAEAAIRRYDIKASGPDIRVADLSGGNQQKVVLARELAVASASIGAPPQLVVAMNPARGLDVSAARFVYEQITRLRRNGAAILLAAADLDELLEWSDRIAVMYAGRLTLTDWPNITRPQIGALMLGADGKQVE